MRPDNSNFNFLENQDYLYYSLAEEKTLINASSKIKLHSIYDFFIFRSLAFNPVQFNPYGTFYDSNSLFSMKLNLVKRFTNSFFPKRIRLNQFGISLEVFNYLVERFSNANLINKIFSSWETHGYGPDYVRYTDEFTKLIIASTNYPLVDKRLELVDVYLDNFPVIHNFSSYFLSFLLYQTFFYFPLVSNIFHTFINFREKTSRDVDIHSLPIIKNKNEIISQLFAGDGNEPYFGFPDIPGTRAPDFYDEISLLIYFLFDCTTCSLCDYEFIAANYESQLICNNGAKISQNIADELFRNMPPSIRAFFDEEQKYS